MWDDPASTPTSRDGPTTTAGPARSAPVAGISPEGLRYAPWLIRVLSFLIDFAPVLISCGIAVAFFSSRTFPAVETLNGVSYTVTKTSDIFTLWPGLAFWWLFVFALAYWLWNKGILEGRTGKSVGKRLTHLTTLRESTMLPLKPKIATARAFLVLIECNLIFLCGIGVFLWLWPLGDPKRQALVSDKLVAAVVFTDSELAKLR